MSISKLRYINTIEIVSYAGTTQLFLFGYPGMEYNSTIGAQNTLKLNGIVHMVTSPISWYVRYFLNNNGIDPKNIPNASP